MDKKVREMLQTIQQNHICVHMGLYGYNLIEKAYVSEFGEYGVSITNIDHLDGNDSGRNIVGITLRDILELEKMEMNDKEAEYRGTSVEGDFIIEVLAS